MKKLLCLIVAIMMLEMALFDNICAQNIMRASFNYDRNGNRISQSIIIIRVDENNMYNDSITDSHDSTETLDDTGIDIIGGINMSIYPNPTCGTLILSTDTSQPSNHIIASLLSFNGNLLDEKNIISTKTEFDLTGFPSGIYFLITNCQNEKHVWKIIKKQ